MIKRPFSLLNALLGSYPNDQKSTYESEFRNKLSQAVYDASKNQDSIREPIEKSISSLTAKYPGKFGADISTNFDTYAKLISEHDYDFGIEEANLLAQVANKLVVIYQKPLETNPKIYGGGDPIMVYFNGGHNYYPLLDPTKSADLLISNSYFMCTMDQTPFFLVYSLDLLKNSLDEYRKSLDTFEKQVNRIQARLDLSEGEAKEIMNQLSVENLDKILSQHKRAHLGVFYLSRGVNANETKQAIVGHKIFVIKSEQKGKFKLGFGYNDRFQACPLSRNRYRRTLLRDLKNRGLAQSDHEANDSLFDYFRRDDVLCRLEEAKCNNPKLKLFPSGDTKQSGLFAELEKTITNVEKDFKHLKTVLSDFLATKADTQLVIDDLVDLSRVCQADMSEECLKEIIPRQRPQMKVGEFSSHLKSTRDELVRLLESNRLVEAAFFMSKVAILLDENNEVETCGKDNHERICLAIAAKYSSTEPERSFKECSKAVERMTDFPVVACWLAKCYETSYGVSEVDYLQAVKNYEREKSSGDLTGIASVSIENLKSKRIITDTQVLKSIGTWYASIGSPEASFWLTEASNSTTTSDDLGLSFSWGQVHETNNDFEKAMRYYVVALKEDESRESALKAIENLDKKLISSQHPDLELEVKLMIEIAEAFEARENRDHVNAVVWFIRASKLGSERATRTLRQMTAKNEFRDVQYALGEYFEATNDLERAAKCYKKMSPANFNAPDEEMRIPSKSESEEDEDAGMYGIDYNANREYTNEEFTGDVYLPVEKLKPISIFYQTSIEFSIPDRRKEMKKGIYCGTLSGLELRPNGLGEWKFDDKEKEQEVRYRGEWQNGRWHGLGDLYETTQNKSSKISVEVSKGRFANGRLMAEDGTSDAHITINKTLNDGVIIEVHIYGQMRETENTRTLLTFFSNNIFAKHYYFHSETMRNRFRRLVQVHVVSSQMGRPGGYEIIGNWVGESNGTYEMSQIVRNEFDDEKNKLVERFVDEVKKFLLKSDSQSRYALLGFYVKILVSDTTLEELVTRILAERDERICPKSFRKVATSLSDLIKIRNEVKEYIKMSKDTQTSARLRDDIETYVRTSYVDWLQGFDKCDQIPATIDVVSILLIDPSVLSMLTQVRERIARVWSLHVNFELDRTHENLANPELVVNFQSAWRNLFKSREKLQSLAGVDRIKLFYSNGYSDFETRFDQIKSVCDQYVRFLDELIGVLARVRSAKTAGKTSRANAFDLFYIFYSKIFSYELHLDSKLHLVDYEQISRQYAIEILKSKEISSSLRHVKLDELLIEFTPDSKTRINFLLNLLEFVFSVDEIMSQNDQLDDEAKSLVKNQVKFLTSLQNKPTIETDRVVNVFIQYLSAYATTIHSWDIFTPFENIASSLNQIKRVLLSCIEYLLSIVDQLTDNNHLIIICDLLAEQKNLIINIDFLPLYVTKSSLFSSLPGFISKRIGKKTERIELDEPRKVVEYLDNELKREKQKSDDEQKPVEDFGTTTTPVQLEHENDQNVDDEKKEEKETENLEEEEDKDVKADEIEEEKPVDKKEDQQNKLEEEIEKIETQKKKKDEKKKTKKPPPKKKLLSRHHSYDLLSRALEILNSRIYRFKETISNNENENAAKLDDMLTMIERYFDILGELVKQLDHQLDADDLDEYVKEKTRLFERSTSFDKLPDLNDYLTALKRFIVVTSADAGRFSTNSQCVAEISRLNPRFKFNDELLQEYDQHFQDFRARFTRNELSVNQLVDELKQMKDDYSSSEDVNHKVVRLVAGVTWIQTVQISKLADSNGSCLIGNESSAGFELSPNRLHVLECLCLLVGGDDEPTKTSTCVKTWLSTRVRPQIAEIADEQSKSAVVCLLVGVYALMDFDVTLVCHNEFSVARDEHDLEASFGKQLIDEGSSSRIRVLMLTDLVRGQIDPTGNPSETPAKLIEQLLLNGAYESDFGTSQDETAMKRNSLIIFDEVDTIVSLPRLVESFEPMKLVSCKELANGVRLIYETVKQVVNRFKQAEPKKLSTEEKKNLATLEEFKLAEEQNTTITKFESAVTENASLARFVETNRSLFVEYFNELWTCALRVVNLYSDHEHKQEKSRRELAYFLDNESNNYEALFRLSKDGTTCEYYHKNKWTSTVYPSYLNAFFYLELFSQQSRFIEPNAGAFGYMKLSCGRVYSTCLVDRVTRSRRVVFGLSSCLRSTSSQKREWLVSLAERRLLKELVLKRTDHANDDGFLFFPAFVEQTVAFDVTKKESFDILGSREEWMERICRTCESLSRSDKPVLVFFRNERDLKCAYERLLPYEPFLLTNNQISLNRFGDRKVSADEFFEHNDQELFEWAESIRRLTTEHCSGQPGKITLLMSDYARGIDFECNSVVSKSGGLHIVQTWFAEDPKEEIQVRARTARDCAPTVFIQILNLADLERVFRQFSKIGDLNKASYDLLRELSNKLMETKYTRIQNEMKLHEERSVLVLNWLERVRKDRARCIDTSSNANKDVDRKLIDEYVILTRTIEQN